LPDSNPSFFFRILLSFLTYWKILFNGEFAGRVQQLGEPSPQPAPTPEPEPEPEPIILKEATPDAALQLLGILQREGRLIDFLEEDVASFSDEEIGAAARVVHEGCHKAVHEYFELASVRSEEEDSRITIKAGFDPSEIRLTGNVVGEPPFTGSLSHRGWRITKVKLPKLAEDHDVSIVAAAEIEL
jgi:hypothetical protein